MKKSYDWFALALAAIIVAIILVVIYGCGDVRIPDPPAPPPPPHAPELVGPPAPAPHADPLLPLLAWLSWISVAGMAACVGAGIFLAVFRSLAVTGFCAFAATLVFSRTLGHALPWLPWIGLAVAVLGIAYFLVRRYRSLALAAVDHGEMADDFILGLGRSILDRTTLKQIQDEWQAAKAGSGEMQAKRGIKKHIDALIAKVNA
jgi:hypothetical protein